MTVNSLNTRTFYEKISREYTGEQKSGQDAFGRFAGDLRKKANQELEEEQSSGGYGTEQKLTTQVDYRSGKIASELLLQKSGFVSMSAAVECSVRHITYEESDHVRICAAEGYALKAQVDVTAHQVYIEQKNEDGSILAYEVNPLLAPEDTDDPVASMALEAWELAKQMFNGGEFSEVRTEKGALSSAEQTGEKTAEGGEDGEAGTTEELFAKRLEEFRAMVKDRIENGPPKIRIGGAEFSEDEWERLLQKIDKEIEAYKEELRARIEKQKEEEDLKRASAGAFVASETLASGKNGNSDGSELESASAAAQRGGSFLARLSGEKKAPYSYLADESGMINYNGVIFVCDDKKQQICLGDVSNPKEVLTIPLSKGGCLKVNRDNLGDLAKAISMFSPEDIERIMRAIAQDTKAREMQFEIDDMESGLGVNALRQ